MTLKVQYATPETLSLASTISSTSIDVSDFRTLSYVADITVAASTAKVFASTAVVVVDSAVTLAAHGLATGRLGQLTTSGTLPTGLSLATNYYIIALDANRIQFATSLANALAGTFVTLSGQGSGNDTFTPTALSGGTWVLQGKNGDSGWVSLATPTAVSTTSSIGIAQDSPTYSNYRVQFVVTAGQLNVVLYPLGKIEE